MAEAEITLSGRSEFARTDGAGNFALSFFTTPPSSVHLFIAKDGYITFDRNASVGQNVEAELAPSDQSKTSAPAAPDEGKTVSEESSTKSVHPSVSQATSASQAIESAGHKVPGKAPVVTTCCAWINGGWSAKARGGYDSSESLDAEWDWRCWGDWPDTYVLIVEGSGRGFLKVHEPGGETKCEKMGKSHGYFVGDRKNGPKIAPLDTQYSFVVTDFDRPYRLKIQFDCATANCTWVAEKASDDTFKATCLTGCDISRSHAQDPTPETEITFTKF